MTMGERIAEYQRKLDELREAGGQKLWLFGKDVEGGRLRAAKAEAISLRNGLLTDIYKQSQGFKDSLTKVLTQEQKELGPVAVARGKGLIDRLDEVTPWMLTGIGVCLLLGLFSRLAAFAGAAFLLSTYLLVPAWPWLPAPPIAEGTYLFVNKNVI